MAQNSFMGTNLLAGNLGVRSVIDEIMATRTQITRTDEIRSVGGWNDPLNEYLAKQLGRIRTTLALVTYQQQPAPNSGASSVAASDGQAERQAIRETQAADENAKLRDLFIASAPLAMDDIQMPATHQSSLPYDFSGAAPDFPQLHDAKYRNVFLKQFILCLDYCVRDISTLSCAESGTTIPANESAVVHNWLQAAFTILQTKGGAKNRPEIINGTDPESLTGKVGPTVVSSTISDPIPELAAAPK
jgi:hypothetical protein